MTKIGAAKHEAINIGTEATPPFAVLPGPDTLFKRRAARLKSLAPGHPLTGYLAFVAAICQAQHDTLAGLGEATPPSAERLAQAKVGSMPPLSLDDMAENPIFRATLKAMVASIAGANDAVSVEAKAAARTLSAYDNDTLATAIAAVNSESIPDGAVAEHALLAAALQVHMARTAARLEVTDLQPVADGVCPACGSPPVASAVVGWPNAQNTRFCTCSMCATQWNVVRVKCVTCGSTGGIGYTAIEGQPDTVKAETCEACNSYVKILYQVNDPALDTFADDVATLSLDLKLAEAGWARGGRNPFLFGVSGGAASAENQDEAS